MSRPSLARHALPMAVVVAVTLTAPLAVARAKQPFNRQQAVQAREAVEHERAIRRGQTTLRRVLRDGRTSPEVKQQAEEIVQLLDRRAQLLASLKQRQDEFVERHEADLARLYELLRQASAIDLELREQRQSVLAASESEIRELKEGSDRAATLLDGLKRSYTEERRARALRARQP